METNIYKKLFEVKKAGIKLQRDTKAFNYKYADLSQIQEKLWEELQKQWLIITHRISDNKVVTDITSIEDTEQFIQSSISMTEWTKAQDKGSEITYYRRYNLLSLLDLEVIDDDWKKAQDSSKTEQVELEWIWPKNIETLKWLIESGKTFTYTDIKAKYKISKENRTKLEDIWIK